MQHIKINVLICIQTLLVTPQIIDYWVCSFSLPRLSQSVTSFSTATVFPYALLLPHQVHFNSLTGLTVSSTIFPRPPPHFP